MSISENAGRATVLNGLRASLALPAGPLKNLKSIISIRRRRFPTSYGRGAKRDATKNWRSAKFYAVPATIRRPPARKPSLYDMEHPLGTGDNVAATNVVLGDVAKHGSNMPDLG